GRVYAQAVAYLAAHLAVLSQRAAFAAGAGVVGGGPVAGVTTGGLSVSFGQAQVTAASSLGDESLKTTAYGLEFLALRASRPKTKGFLVRPRSRVSRPVILVSRTCSVPWMIWTGKSACLWGFRERLTSTRTEPIRSRLRRFTRSAR